MSGLVRIFFAWAVSALRLVAHVLFFAPNGVMAAATWCEKRAGMAPMGSSNTGAGS